MVNTKDFNVIADSRGGDPNHVVVVDTHLDAIYGAGILIHTPPQPDCSLRPPAGRQTA